MNLTPLGAAAPGERLQVPRGAAERLRALIDQGELKAGDRLPAQRALAERLGISRPSLREAISSLETMGLVVVKVGSGVYVAPPALRAPPWRFADRCSPRDLYEARAGLEGFAARLAAGRADDAALVRLEASVEAMAAALARGDVPAMAAADAAFHDAVLAGAANPALAAMVGPMREMIVESQRLPMADRARLGETLAEHRAILALLAARDADGAGAAMQAHIAAAARRGGIAI